MKKFLIAAILSISLLLCGCTTVTGCCSQSALAEQEQLEKNDTFVPHWAK